MKVSSEIKKAEVIKRMKKLDIFDETIRQFENSDLVSCSEPPVGANYWLDEEQRKIVEKFEKENNALVYFAVRSYTGFGKLDSFLYISDYKEDWEYDNESIDDGYVFAYVYNYDIPEFSELGGIAVKPRFGGLVRVG